MASHFYNVNARVHGGKIEGVYTSKTHGDCEKGTSALDIERGIGKPRLGR